MRSRQVMLDGVGNRTGEEFDRAISDEHLKMISEDWRDLYIGDYIGAPSATIYRKGAPEYEEKLTWIVDVEFYMRLLRRNPRFVVSKEPLVSIGVSENQLTESCRTDGKLNIFEYGFVMQEFSLLSEEKYRQKFIQIALKYKMPFDRLRLTGFRRRSMRRRLRRSGGKILSFMSALQSARFGSVWEKAVRMKMEVRMVQILQKLLHILNKDQKRKVAGLGVMIFIGALMEMIGVGLIMPVVEGVMAPDQLLNKWYIQILERFIHFDTPNQWLLFLIGVIIAVYFIKNGYLLLQTYVQSRFVNTNQSNTISYMLEEYLNRPYEFYLNADIPT
ncbi:MAG: hypothetical protein ACLURV_00005, partial [Gallintestinimicrobium sp.]